MMAPLVASPVWVATWSSGEPPEVALPPFAPTPPLSLDVWPAPPVDAPPESVLLPSAAPTSAAAVVSDCPSLACVSEQASELAELTDAVHNVHNRINAKGRKPFTPT